MELVWFRKGADEPRRFSTSTDGKISFITLSNYFGLKPGTITLSGDVYSEDKTGKSLDSWTDIKNLSNLVGTEEAPVLVGGLPKSEARAEPGDRTELFDDDEMYKFVAALHSVRDKLKKESTIPEVSIDLEVGVAWLGNPWDFSNQIFVRKAYIDLLLAHKKFVDQRGGEPYMALFTGTPGIGMSHLAALMVANYLVDEKVVVLELAYSTTPRSTFFYRLELSKDGTPRVSAINSVCAVCNIFRQEEAVFVVDGGVSRIPPSIVNIKERLIFASPNSNIFKDKRKHGGTLVLYVPLFSLDELVLCSQKITRLQGLTAENIADWFWVAGGVALRVLKDASEGIDTLDGLRRRLKNRLLNLKASDLRENMSQVGRDTFPPGSDSIFHWAVGIDEHGSPLYTEKFVVFASPYVVGLLSLIKGIKEAVYAAAFCMTTGGQLEQAAWRGYWFEQLAHILLVAGGNFTCRLLGSGQPQDFELKLKKHSTVECFHSLKHAASLMKLDVSIYCMPWASNQVALDALCTPVLYFQMASGKQHGINRKGMQEIVESFQSLMTTEAFGQLTNICDGVSISPQMPLLLFVTMVDNFDDHYKYLQLYTEGNRKSKLQKALVHQGVLKLPLSTILKNTDVSAFATKSILRAMESVSAKWPLVEQLENPLREGARLGEVKKPRT